MPFEKLPPGVKRERLNLNLDPRTIEKLKKMSVELDLPISRVVDQIVLNKGVSGVVVKPVGRDIDQIIEELKAKKR